MGIADGKLFYLSKPTPGCKCEWCTGQFYYDSTDNGTILPDGMVWFKKSKTVVPSGCRGGVLVCKPSDFRTVSSKQTGYNCMKCNERNDYACSNTSDGKYVCFNCR